MLQPHFCTFFMDVVLKLFCACSFYLMNPKFACKRINKFNFDNEIRLTRTISLGFKKKPPRVKNSKIGQLNKIIKFKLGF